MGRVKVSQSREVTILNHIKQAIVNEEFHFVYQPKMAIQNSELTGFEALIRWDSPVLGFVSPAEFIPVVERYGYIEKLGEYVVRKNIELIGRCIESHMHIESIAVNVSPIELGNENYTANMIELCEQYNVPRSKLQLEITEDVRVSTVDGAIETLTELKNEGFTLVVDDFGSGHASELLRTGIPMDIIKLDKSFIDELPRNKETVRRIIELAQLSDYDIIAEGVETEEQLDILSKLNCSQIQGYYYSKPLEEDELMRWCPQCV